MQMMVLTLVGTIFLFCEFFTEPERSGSFLFPATHQKSCSYIESSACFTVYRLKYIQSSANRDGEHCKNIESPANENGRTRQEY